MNIKHIGVVLSLVFSAQPLFAEQAAITSKPPIQATAAPTQTINLNKADVAMLAGSFKGIGMKRAEAIVAYREAHQGFKSLDELAEVKGIGQRFVERNRDELQMPKKAKSQLKNPKI